MSSSYEHIKIETVVIEISVFDFGASFLFQKYGLGFFFANVQSIPREKEFEVIECK
jgi:hypothetical protein